MCAPQCAPRGRAHAVFLWQLETYCMDALHWGCRLLPFARFLNAEEVLQDVLLSLASALPPVPMVTASSGSALSARPTDDSPLTTPPS